MSESSEKKPAKKAVRGATGRAAAMAAQAAAAQQSAATAQRVLSHSYGGLGTSDTAPHTNGVEPEAPTAVLATTPGASAVVTLPSQAVDTAVETPTERPSAPDETSFEPFETPVNDATPAAATAPSQASHTVAPDDRTTPRSQPAEPESAQPITELASHTSEDGASASDATGNSASLDGRASGEAPRSRRTRRRTATIEDGSAHAEIYSSYVSAKIDATAWVDRPIRLHPGLMRELRDRVSADRKACGVTDLAISHYVDAAIQRMPADVEQQIELGKDFLRRRMGVMPAGKGTTLRLSPGSSETVAALKQNITDNDFGGRGVVIISAAVEDFLARLDDAGPLPPPPNG